MSETLVAPDFDVLGAEPVAHAAAPTLRFTLRVADASGRAVQGILLVRADQHRPGAADLRRRHARAARGAVRRARAVGGDDAQLPVDAGRRAGAAVHGRRPTSRSPSPCTYDLEVAAAKYFYSLPDGQIPLTLHFSGTVLYEDADGRLQLTMVPWSCSREVHAPGRHLAGDDGRVLPGRRAGCGWRPRRSTGSPSVKAREGLPSFDATVEEPP